MRDGDVDGRERLAPEPRVRLDGGAEGVLQELREDVVERHLDVREGRVHVARDLDRGHVSVAVLGDLLDEGHPPLDDPLQVHPHIDDANVAILVKENNKDVRNRSDWKSGECL